MSDCQCKIVQSPHVDGVPRNMEQVIQRCLLHENADKLLLLLESPLINGSAADVAEWLERRAIAIKAIRESQ